MSASWATARRVLAIRLDSMGDVLMTTPAIRAIRHAASVEHLTLLTSPAGAAIARLVPDIDEVLVYEAPWMKAGSAHSADVDQAMIAQLAQGSFDAAVVFTVFSQTPFPAAMLAHLAGIPLGLAYTRERAYKLMSNAVDEPEPEGGIRHEVRRHLDLVASVGWTTSDERMSVRASAEGMARADELVQQFDRPPAEHAELFEACPERSRGRLSFSAKVKEGRAGLRQAQPVRSADWVLVHPGASAPSRRWPPDYYAQALRVLAGHGLRFVLTGDASEVTLIDDIIAEAGIDALNVGGQLDLDTLVALIARAPLVISNNTGPAHIAAAVGTPVVDLYALTNPQHTPWAVPSRVLSHDVECRWCFASVCRTGHHLCLRGVTPAQVVDAALELLAQPDRAAA